MNRLATWVLSSAVLAAGCAPSQAVLPLGASCPRSVVVEGDAALQRALAAAGPGTCVVARAGTYRQAVVVPERVTVAAELGATVEIAAGTTSQPAVTLAAGALLSGVRVRAAPGVGVAGVGGGVRLFDVVVQGAGKGGVVFWCEDDCRVADFAELIDCELTGNAVGLFARGARVRMTGGAVKDSASTGLDTGYGVVASAGAVLELDGTGVEGNQEVGVLIDGLGDTEATLARVSVRANLGRGLWAQGLTGTATMPRLRLTDATVERNRLVGVGARGSGGLRITGGRIASTITGSAASATPGVMVQVGDGLGLFDSTGAVSAEQVTLEGNERSQALIDTAAPGVVLAPSVTVTPGTAMGVVVQRTTVAVQATSPTVPQPGQELPVSAPTLGVPTR